MSNFLDAAAGIAVTFVPLLAVNVIVYLRFVRRATIGFCLMAFSLVRAAFGIGGVILVSYNLVGMAISSLSPISGLDVFLQTAFLLVCFCIAYVAVMLLIHVALNSALLRLDCSTALDVELQRKILRVTRWWRRIHGFLAARKGVDFLRLLDGLCTGVPRGGQRSPAPTNPEPAPDDDAP